MQTPGERAKDFWRLNFLETEIYALLWLLRTWTNPQLAVPHGQHHQNPQLWYMKSPLRKTKLASSWPPPQKTLVFKEKKLKWQTVPWEKLALVGCLMQTRRKPLWLTWVDKKSYRASSHTNLPKTTISDKCFTF